MWFRCGFVMLLAGLLVMAGCESQVSEEPSVKVPQKKADQEVKEKQMGSRVKLETSMGDIVIELDEKKAPVTVANFRKYAEDGFYAGTIFHRVISGFMIQGGGFTEDMAKKDTDKPIINEAGNGLRNDRGTIAMARTSNPDSASSQFFINLKNNVFLNFTGPTNPGYAVFGKVVEGMDIVDKIAAVKTKLHRGMSDVPVEPVVITSAKVVSEF